MTIKTSITMRVDRDVLEYFRQGGAGYQTRMNRALREYMEVQDFSKPEVNKPTIKGDE